VTIAIGLLTKNKGFGKGQIVFACESEITDEVAKTQSARKLNLIQFSNGKALAVYSKSVDMGDAVMEIFQRRAQDAKIDSPTAVARVAEDSMLELRNRIVDMNKNCQIDWHRYFFEDYPLEMLVGYYFNGCPHIYRLNLNVAVVAKRVNAAFSAIGVGKDLAEFLLREYSQADPDFDFGDIIATSVIEKVKDNVKGCGGQTWVGIAVADIDTYAEKNWTGYKEGELVKAGQSDAFICRRETISAIAAKIRQQESEGLQKKKEQIAGMLQSLCKEIGPLEYSDDPNAVRTSVYAKSQSQMDSILKKHVKRLKSRKRPF